MTAHGTTTAYRNGCRCDIPAMRRILGSAVARTQLVRCTTIWEKIR